MTIYFKKTPVTLFLIGKFARQLKKITPVVTGDLKRSTKPRRLKFAVTASEDYASHVFFPKSRLRLRSPKVRRNRAKMKFLLQSYSTYLDYVDFENKYGKAKVSALIGGIKETPKDIGLSVAEQAVLIGSRVAVKAANKKIEKEKEKVNGKK